MNRTIHAVAVALALLWPAGAIAQAVTLVTGPNYAPFTGEQLPEGGMATELVRAVYKAEGQDTTIVFQPWKRGAEGTVKGEFFATFPYVKSAEREQEYLFSASMFDVRQLVYVPGNSPLKFDTTADFKGKTACSPLGSAPPPEIKAMIDAGEVKLQSPADMNGCFRILAAGRVDFYIINEYNGRAALKELGVTPDQVRIEPKPFAQTSQYLIVGKATPGAAAGIARFNEGLAKVRASGEYDRIVRKHVGG